MERAQPYFVYMKIFILFVLLIYIYIIFKFLAGAFIQRDLNEENRRNQTQQKSSNMQVLYYYIIKISQINVHNFVQAIIKGHI